MPFLCKTVIYKHEEPIDSSIRTDLAPGLLFHMTKISEKAVSLLFTATRKPKQCRAAVQPCSQIHSKRASKPMSKPQTQNITRKFEKPKHKKAVMLKAPMQRKMTSIIKRLDGAAVTDTDDQNENNKSEDQGPCRENLAPMDRELSSR